MSKTRGRPRSFVHNYFQRYETDVEDSNGRGRVLCTACRQWNSIPDPKRMAKHLSGCSMASDAMKAEAQTYLDQRVGPSNAPARRELRNAMHMKADAEAAELASSSTLLIATAAAIEQQGTVMSSVVNATNDENAAEPPRQRVRLKRSIDSVHEPLAPPVRKESVHGGARSKGRPKSRLYRHFQAVANPDSADRPRVLCLSCQSWESISDPQRMAKHLLACRSASEDTKEEASEYLARRGFLDRVKKTVQRMDVVRQHLEVDADGNVVSKRLSGDETASDSGPAQQQELLPQQEQQLLPQLPRPRQQRPPNKARVVGGGKGAGILSLEDANLVQEHFARACVVRNVPWSFIQDQWFREAIAVIRPGLELPVHSVAFQQAIERIHAKTVTPQAEFFAKTQHVTFVCGNASIGNGATSLYVLAVNESRQSELFTVLVRDQDTSPESFCTMLEEKAVALKNSGAVMHFTSTASGALETARKQLKADLTTPVGLVGGCMMQQTKFMLTDTVSAFPLVQHALEIAGRVANQINGSSELSNASTFAQAVRARLNDQLFQEGKASVGAFPMYEPTTALWYSGLLCLRQCMRLKTILREIATAFSAESFAVCVDVSVRPLLTTLVDEETWADIQEAINLLQPLCNIIALSESDRCSSGQILLVWIWLLSQVRSSTRLRAEHKAQFEEKFFKRLRKHSEEHHFVCAVLDPRISGAGLSAKGMRNARVFASRLLTKLLPKPSLENFGRSWLDFLQKRNQFISDYWCPFSVQHPLTFWNQYANDKEAEEIFAVGKAVTSYTPSVQPNDRVWNASPAEFDWNDPEQQTKLDQLMRVKFNLLQRKPLAPMELRNRYAKLIDPIDAVELDMLLKPIVLAPGIVSQDDPLELMNPSACPTGKENNGLFPFVDMLNDVDDDLELEPRDEAADATRSGCDISSLALDWFDFDDNSTLNEAVSRTWAIMQPERVV